MSSLAIGIDVSKDKLDVALLLEDRTYQLYIVPNNKTGFRSLRKWLKKRDALASPVCLEATGRYGDAVAEYLFKQKLTVSVVNPAQIKAYGQSQLKRNKTDREDAKVIAHFCWTQQPRAWQPLSPEIKELQALVRHLQTIKEDRTRLKNRQKSGITSKIVLRDIKQQIAALNKRIEKLENEIKQHIDAYPMLLEQVDLLKSIPGIGHTTAALIISELPNTNAFSNVGEVVAYAGLSPRVVQSGSPDKRNVGIDKTGRTRLRTAFYMPALVAIRHNPIVVALAQRLTERGKPPMVIVAAAMRKLLHLVYGVLKHQRPFDPNHLQKQMIAA